LNNKKKMTAVKKTIAKLGHRSVLRLVDVSKSAALGVAILLGQCLAARAAADAVGGGWLHGGVVGEYFNNDSLTGSPSFTRRDVRVDFAWGPNARPGGSRSPGFSDLGADNFSVRWTGRIMPRFSESYTFKVIAEDGARLFIKATNSVVWTTLLDAWNTAGTNVVSTNLLAGQAYDFKLEYHETTGSAVCRLLWSSPSTPEEVVESASLAGLNMDSYGGQMWANAMDGGRDEWAVYNAGTPVPRDTNGWPVGDATNIVFEGQSGSTMGGTYLLQFKGRAQVSASFFGSGKFTANGTNYAGEPPVLPFGAGYNAASNLTTATLNFSNASILYLGFSNTRRNPGDSTATGVSEVKLMRPVSAGSSTNYPLGTVFTDSLKAACQRYTVLRWILNFDTDINWSDRVLPAYSTHVNIGSQRYWEQMVMLANETGKDLFVCLPVRASNAYLTNVANLIRYGSDGVNPYTSEQANPVYPPLNPNLHVILEHGNEIWNYSFSNWGNNLADMKLAYTNNTADWQIVNYDNVYDGSNNEFQAAMRWHILRALRASEIFRSVFGDGAIGSRVRVIYEYQYDDYQSSATHALPFVDNYFNNADGVHVPNPQPVNYYFWGAGGATYYASGNSDGVQTNIVFANSGFESPVLAAGQTQTNPAGSSWTFTGRAGIYRPGSGGITNLPPQGSQAAFIQGTGTMSQTVTFTNTGTFALRMQSAAKENNINTVRFYFDNTFITPDGSSAFGAITTQWWPGQGWGRDSRNFGNYSTYVFQVTNTGPHTLKIEGLGVGQYDPINNAPNTNLFVYFDQLEIVSADALFAGGIPGAGQANGQVASDNYTDQLFSQARYAQAYGLQVVAYEGGWSLGGDFGATAFQNWCKYFDPRARTAQRDSIDTFARSGSRYNVFGTYETWPASDTPNSGLYPLAQAVDDHNAALPLDPVNGITVPNILKPAGCKWQINATASSGVIGGTGGWFHWNVLVPVSGTFIITTTNQNGANAVLEVDGKVQGPSFAGNATRTNYLTKGLHAIKVRSTSGSFTVTNLMVSQIGAPAAPAVTAITDGSGTKLVAWSAVSGATGYIIYWGTARGVYTSSADVTTNTSTTLTGLTHDQTYYIVVRAYNGIGLGLPSVEVGTTGNEATQPPSASTSRLIITNLSRGPGLRFSDYSLTYTSDSFAYGQLIQNDSGSSTNVASALSKGHYTQFTVTPKPGTTVSIDSLLYAPYWQNVAPALANIGIAYSTNGSTFTIAAVSGTPSVNGGSPLTATLTGIAALQNLTGTVTFRLLQPALGVWSFAGIGKYSGDDIVLMGSVNTLSVATPTFTPPAGTYTNSQSVTISNATAGSSIRYTTDGSTPTSSYGTVYTGPVTVSANTTLRAIAYQANFVDSAVASSSYTINLQPVTISLSRSGANLLLTWPQGTLLQATNLTGPWATNLATSPYLVSPINGQMFYRIQVQ
jgi:hypothetical protein